MPCKKKRNLLYHNSKELKKNYVIKHVKNVLSITRYTFYEYKACLYNDNNPVLLGNMLVRFVVFPVLTHQISSWLFVLGPILTTK